MNFESLQHSVFLQALGSAILNSLWQVFIIWLIYETVNAAYKTASAKFKNNLSTVLLFFSFAWFLVNFISKFFKAEKLISVASLPSNNIEINSIHNTSVIQTILTDAIGSLPYLSVAYIFLLFFLMAKLFASYRYVYFIANKRLILPPLEFQTFANKVALQMRITKKIGVWISHHIDVPATIGFMKPVILIPVASINNLSTSQLEAIILHELSHIKRNDYIINIIISVIETILFFNPFVLLLSKVIKRERENCCDDFVLQYRYDPHSYASALLCLEQSRRNNLQLAIGAVSGKKQLLSRIKRITNCHVVSKQFNYGQKLLALLLVTGIICSVAWLSPEKKSSSAQAIHGKSPYSFTLPKAVKVVPPAIVYQKIEKQEKNNAKTVNIKNNQPIPLTEKNSEDFSAESFNNSEALKNDQHFSAPKIDGEFATLADLKQPKFFLDGGSIKLPGIINITNFPFQNMSFNIDLSKIDLKKLNSNLKEAYNQINSLNWNEIQSDIAENFKNSEGKNFSQNEKDNSSNENNLDLSKLRTMKDPRLFNKKAISNWHRQMFLQDSLKNEELSLLYQTNKKVQQVYKEIKKQCAQTNDTYYFIPNRNAVLETMYKQESTNCPTKRAEASVSNKKDIKIVIRRLSHLSKNPDEKKSFHYFFNETRDKSNPENIISIQVTETP